MPTASARRLCLPYVRAVNATMALILWLACATAFQSGLASSQDHPRESLQIIVTGIGRPPADASSPTQAKAMAERAAFLQALREAAKKSGRSVPPDYTGPIRVGTTVKGFRVTRITPLPDGSVEVEVSLPRAGASP